MASAEELHATAVTLQIDIMMRRVIEQLDAIGVEAIALKGASFATWLYGSEHPRFYGDGDVLVSPDDLEATGRVLTTLGFVIEADERASGHMAFEPHAQLWRGEGVYLDLHWRLPGMGIDPAAAWTVLAAHVESLELAGAPVRVLDEPARALHVALHVTNRRGSEKPIRDLERALDVVDARTWDRAAELALQLGALEAMARGLRSIPRGEALANRLRLLARETPETLLAQQPNVSGVYPLVRLLTADGSRTRALLRELIPPANVMRGRYPVARSGRGGLVRAHGQRLARGVRAAPRATGMVVDAIRRSSR